MDAWKLAEELRRTPWFRLETALESEPVGDPRIVLLRHVQCPHCEAALFTHPDQTIAQAATTEAFLELRERALALHRCRPEH